MSEIAIVHLSSTIDQDGCATAAHAITATDDNRPKADTDFLEPLKSEQKYMNPSLASFAQYFRIGLEVGISKPEQVREWAISVIDQMEQPPGEIIEVSWRKPLAQLISDLNEVKGEPQIDLVSSWLLGKLSQTMESGNDSLDGAVRRAMGIARAAGDNDLYDVFDAIDDELQLAVSQTYGTVAACRKFFDKALEAHGSLPFSPRKI